jgi:hypothetical protein
MCEYNLRGLTEPRCPECGFQFQWAELLDPIRRGHPYLFEHHAGRNLWSLRQTLSNGLWATKFWQSLHPGQPSRPRRMLIYAILTSLPWLIMLLVQLGLGTAADTVWRYGTWIPTSSGGWVHSPAGRFPSLAVLELNVQSWLAHDQFSQFMIVCLLWPWLTLAGLYVFRWSMRRAHIRHVHVLRCIIYSSDVLLLMAPVFAVSIGLFWTDVLGTSGMSLPLTVLRSHYSFLHSVASAGAVALLLVFTYRLILAYRYYLRFDHAIATVLCAELMAFLVAWKLVFLIGGY